MPIFVPHKTLIEILWYAGMSIGDIDEVLVNNRYNSLPQEVYEGIIEGVDTVKWRVARAANEEVHAYNRDRKNSFRLRALYFDESDFNDYLNPYTVYDLMCYVAGAKNLGKGKGSFKASKIFATSRLRQFVETGAISGMPVEAIRQNLVSLDPSYGGWSNRVIVTYMRVFWDASRMSIRSNNIRNYDIRCYYDLDPDNNYYYPHRLLLEGSEDDVLSYFGVADYGSVQRKNKALHGKIGGQINEYFDNKTRRIIPSDYIKLFVHLDQQIKDNENKDNGVEEYRAELRRIFECLEHTHDNYKTMDELSREYISIDLTIEVDEPYMKEQK